MADPGQRRETSSEQRGDVTCCLGVKDPPCCGRKKVETETNTNPGARGIPKQKVRAAWSRGDAAEVGEYVSSGCS